MSSGNLVMPENVQPFFWHDSLDKDAFIFVTYRVISIYPGEETAVGMAMEQSASTLNIRDYVVPEMLADWTICVRRITNSGHAIEEAVSAYTLETEVYPQHDNERGGLFEIELAVPWRLLSGKPAQLANVLVGELPRLGFLTAFQLTDVVFPTPYLVG